MRYRFAFFTTVLTFIVLVLGVLVVATDAGDACGFDWPYCDGKLYPDITNPLQVIEYTHRLVTAALGFVILINTIIALWRRKQGEKAILVLAPLSLLLLVVQAGVGGLNVLLSTPPGFTTLDVVISLALFSSLVFLTVALQRKPVTQLTDEMAKSNAKLRLLYKPALWSMIAFYFVTFIGALFKHSAASQILLGMTSKTRLFESLTLSQLLYSIHGIMGIAIVVMIFQVVLIAHRERVLFGLALLLGMLFLIESLIGFITYSTNLSVFSGSIHTLMASLIMGVGSYILAKAMLGEHVKIES